MVSVSCMILLAVLLTACGGGGGGDTGGETSTEPEVEATISPEGGEITSPDDNVNIFIPANALESDTLLTISYSQNGVQLGQLGELITLGPENIEFNVPVILTINYDPNTIPSEVNEGNLFIGRIGPYDSWETIEDSQVDTINHQVSAEIAHFSIHGILYSLSTDTSMFRLRFPLEGYTPDNVPISSVFDHHHQSQKSYDPDGKVSAFTGELAIGEKDSNGFYVNASGPVLGDSYGFSNQCKTDFYVNSNYTGGGETNFLFYDGHPALIFYCGQ